ncbi:lyase family protein [Mycolicibacterium sp. P9-22]|uniref:lyase family protein n=1 Tax=Mycolicibacterium sp. P9-22 TaxID=2024613 RepID=UPI0011EBC5A1|nr:lyase family protein [Mycolicibacterium sp. P9-22]KAA0117988.1 3-carboxy-cis,cis-muconate cycloisomerase [Mycolicibacterium sp. P9-22]
MSDLFWPGDHRAGTVMSDAALLTALAQVENAWLTVLVDVGIAPAGAAADLTALVSEADLEGIAAAAEKDGNPVTAVVALLRERAGGETATWLHRGLTSQDVLDTALMLCTRDALAAVHTALAIQVHTLVGLIEMHGAAPLLTRTLTQPALPGTFGGKFAVWLTAILDAAEALPALRYPVQCGGAAGTMAATTELSGSPEAALGLATALAAALDLDAAPPWHTTRSVLTRLGDALVTCTDAWGHVANDIAAGIRAGELAEGSGGGSSTMPHKNNPVLTVLLRRTAMSAPQLGATMHTASAAGVDERSDGGWHTEWATLRTLARRTVVAASQTADLLKGLRVDTATAAANLAAAQGIHAEQQSMQALTGRTGPTDYLGVTAHLVDAAVQRAGRYLKENRDHT